jgi:hypothetical protein
MIRIPSCALAALVFLAACSSGPQTAHAPTTISWERFEALVLAEEVVEIQTRRDGTIRLRLADGRHLVTDPPAEGETLRLLERCGEPCAKIKLR